ncbi:MAG TPA: hypothetical protein VFS44_14450 [Gemmatimonadaceae bacterium]|nr:hypothetical protein [Gemmatimonadaceae bacterium]
MSVVRSALLSLACAALSAAPLRAQGCDSLVTRTAPDTLSGRRIDSVRVVTLSPDPLPGPAAIVDHLHVRTQEGTIRRQLLFAAGDTIDTLRVAETMRRLRGHRYLTDAWLTARGCSPSGGVTLTVTTRDAWSTRPEVKLGASGKATMGVEERNLLGTGRAANLYVRSNGGSQLGVGAMVSDPWVPYTGLSATLSTNSYRDGADWHVDVTSRNLTIFDPWRTEIVLGGSTYHPADDSSGTFGHQWASVLVSRVVAASPRGVTSVIGGAETERGRLFAGPGDAIVGPARVMRRFIGADVGLRRETARYDTLTWMLPGDGLADLPLGFEWEGVLGLGKELESGRGAAHLDLWGGRAWMPRRGHLLVADVWSSGFIGDGFWHAGTIRGLLSYYAAAPRGTWQARLGAERLFDPDPDVRALATVDPALSLYPRDSRLAELAVSASLERDVELRKLSSSWNLDGALFAAYSARHDPASPDAEHLQAGVLGFGLRLAPRRAGRATFRVDVGFPVTHSPGLKGKPYFGVTVMPWLGADRERDGRRDR